MKVYEKPSVEVIDFTTENIMSGNAGFVPGTSEGVEK